MCPQICRLSGRIFNDMSCLKCGGRTRNNLPGNTLFCIDKLAVSVWAVAFEASKSGVLTKRTQKQTKPSHNFLCRRNRLQLNLCRTEEGFCKMASEPIPTYYSVLNT